MGPAIFWSIYSLIGVASGRFTYNNLRALAIKDFGVNWAEDGDETVFWCVVLGGFFAFPLWPIALVSWLIFGKPKKTPEEVEAENEALRKKVDQLEKEAGFGQR